MVDAVHCAVEIQRGMMDRNTDTPEDKRITFRVGIKLGDEEGASRVLKHNEVVFSTIPPGISPRSQSDQSLNFGLPVRGVEVEMKPTPAAWTPIATLE